MLDIGFLELMLIGIVGLLVLGPERLPRAARTTGMWIGKIKRTVSGMQREISAQLEAEELRQKLNEQQKKLDDSLKKAKLDVESIADTPSTPRSAPATKATQSETEQRVAKASSRLDDALQTVREETPPSSIEPEPTESQKAASNKDRNHQ
ncbi:MULTISPECIES: Sec-independent protein translocase protein TatB [Halomonadaceae]|jgi:sec-independent protein translocase protein TatB|uniref:Sec-independent protein translocase protein TatB n=1 Tax=Halomonadaceae TaxID=28256 RepID=UPI000C32798D|nr:Sec-independent protein translocase protein TatB [Halomonas sp. MES3-P3E]PKG48518.1 twin-arginine translocase subunit TatB [Halomonas sp. MES3-P3E]|tara:strand:+ start:73335 stop:73787 length:453 start_codon:yes stop_codon:yes gene_type:complete